MLSRCVPQPPNVLNTMVANQYNITAVSNDGEGRAMTPGGSEVNFLDLASLSRFKHEKLPEMYSWGGD